MLDVHASVALAGTAVSSLGAGLRCRSGHVQTCALQKYSPTHSPAHFSVYFNITGRNGICLRQVDGKWDMFDIRLWYYVDGDYLFGCVWVCVFRQPEGMFTERKKTNTHTHCSFLTGTNSHFPPAPDWLFGGHLRSPSEQPLRRERNTYQYLTPTRRALTHLLFLLYNA